MITSKNIIDAWAKIREIDSTIPDDVLDFMKEAALEKLPKEFTLFWLDGKREVVTGRDIADAINNAGYGAGALRALDFHSPGDNNDYVWKEGRWELTDKGRVKLFGNK